MAGIQELLKAPIVEAIIDFRCTLVPGFPVERLNLLKQDSSYEEPQPIRQIAFDLKFPPESAEPVLSVNHPIGWRNESTDGKFVAQLTVHGFTLSRLAPYAGWGILRAEAERLYALYSAACEPLEVTRLAVRYINRISLPLGEAGDFSGFLTSPPHFPASHSVTQITGFSSQIQLHYPNLGVSANVSQVVEPSTSETVPVLLDIDVFKTGTMTPDPTLLMPQLEELRVMKNFHFFSGITEKTLRLLA